MKTIIVTVQVADGKAAQAKRYLSAAAESLEPASFRVNQTSVGPEGFDWIHELIERAQTGAKAQ